jgi:hypothetical protein
MSPLQQALYGLVLQGFERGTFTPKERRDLAVIDRKAGLSAEEVDDVFRALLRAKWGDVIDDDALGASDWARLSLVVSALGLPSDRVPFPVKLRIAI